MVSEKERQGGEKPAEKGGQLNGRLEIGRSSRECEPDLISAVHVLCPPRLAQPANERHLAAKYVDITYARTYRKTSNKPLEDYLFNHS